MPFSPPLVFPENGAGKGPFSWGFLPPPRAKKYLIPLRFHFFGGPFGGVTWQVVPPLCQRAGQWTKPRSMGLRPSARGTKRREIPLFPVRRSAPPPGRRAWGAETGTPAILRWPVKGKKPGPYGWEKTGFPVIFQEVVYRKTITFFQAFPVVFPAPFGAPSLCLFPGMRTGLPESPDTLRCFLFNCRLYSS